MDEAELTNELTPILDQFGLELDGLEVKPAGRRSVLRVTVDGDGPEGRGPKLDDIAEATRAISAALDESAAVGRGAYTLEVSSRGVSAPLTRPQHWRRNTGRLVRISLVPGQQVAGVADGTLEGRIATVTDEGVAVRTETDEVTVPFPTVGKAVVQVDMSKRAAEHAAGTE